MRGVNESWMGDKTIDTSSGVHFELASSIREPTARWSEQLDWSLLMSAIGTTEWYRVTVPLVPDTDWRYSQNCESTSDFVPDGLDQNYSRYYRAIFLPVTFWLCFLLATTTCYRTTTTQGWH